MSSINQFFPSAGGLQSPTPATGTPDFPVRVQITEGGGGAGCFAKLDWCTISNNSCEFIYISGKGGGVADLNLVLDPGTTCSITVGTGGSSYSVPIVETKCPDFTYPPTCTCITGIMGEFGGPSKFENYGFYPNGTSAVPETAPFKPGSAFVPYSYSYALCNKPSFCVPCLIECDVPVEIQNIPSPSFVDEQLVTNYKQDKGLRLYLSDRSCRWGCDGISQCCTVEAVYSPTCVDRSVLCACFQGGFSGGGADNETQMLRWSTGYVCNTSISSPLCIDFFCFSEKCGSNCGGYTSYITGAVCAYGVGGAKGRKYPTPTSPPLPAANACYCVNNELCYHPHAQYRFPGSGGGASTVACAVLEDPTVPCSVICDGCPGSVIVQYPTCFGAAVSTGSSVIDCSPNTPGFRTYKFMCPGTIQFP